MMTLPAPLSNFMQGQKLDGLKPFALLYRNKWDSVNNTYAIDTANPIDISGMILKPNTLSMTLDVNEVAQYNANNVTLSLSDTENRFVEGTPNSYFPAGYQLYGSKVVLYYGITSPINPYPTQVGYTVVGSPTITDGVLSNFNASNHLKFSSQTFSPGSGPFEIQLDYTTGNSATSYGYSLYLPCININQPGGVGRFRVNITTTTETFYLQTVKLANTKYVLKVTYDGNGLYALYSNGVLVDSRSSTQLNTTSATFDYTIGIREDSVGAKIDLNHTYIKVNGEYWFNGAHFFWQNNSTPLFTGVIKDLPTYKPENYQVDLKLVSPLEMLKDIEAKDFSDKVTGEELTYKSTDSDGHRIYWTTGTGVGGFEGVYANGTKLFEGVDYETDQLNALGLPAIVKIINSDLYSSTITSDYYTWKTGLTVEQIVAGLVGLAGYDSQNEDIRNVVWNNQVRTQRALSSVLTLGYKATSNTFTYKGNSVFYGGTLGAKSSYYRYSQLNNNCKISFVAPYSKGTKSWRYFLGDLNNSQPYNGIEMYAMQMSFFDQVAYVFFSYSNGNATTFGQYNGQTLYLDITIQNGNITINANGSIFTTSVNFTGSGEYNEKLSNQTNSGFAVFSSNTLQDLKTGATIEPEGVIFSPVQKITQSDVWVAFQTELENTSAQYQANFLTSEDNNTWSTPSPISIGSYIGKTTEYIQFLIYITTSEKGNILNSEADVLTNELSLQLVNLSGLTVLEALQDFALISGYEFGVDRQGVFFFRPRLSSTTPVYVLDHSELVKVDTVKKNLSDFFTKLTLTFAQVPLEFYANTGARPTPIDKYGVINKEIDKPDIVNYDNPELAQAIGPQLLEVYSALPDVIQVVGKLNLALELADIVNLKRNYNLIEPEIASDYEKYQAQQTYYRACKITGMNYNFAKRQITYTLRDVSNANNMPPINAYGFVYDLPIQLGKLKTE